MKVRLIISETDTKSIVRSSLLTLQVSIHDRVVRILEPFANVATRPVAEAKSAAHGSVVVDSSNEITVRSARFPLVIVPVLFP